MPSSSSSPLRAALTPSRETGRRRVNDLLAAASEVFQERGYEATTMAEIAARAGAKIGSLYRFFPGKDAIAEAVLRQHMETLHAAYAAIRERAAHATPEQLADILIDLLVDLYPSVKALPALMDARTDRMEIRRHSRALALEGIAAALMVCAPALDTGSAGAMAAVVANMMKTMLGMTLKDAPTAPGAIEELRLMNRLYLSARLAPYRNSGGENP